jgi:hypothetical protein
MVIKMNLFNRNIMAFLISALAIIKGLRQSLGVYISVVRKIRVQINQVMTGVSWTGPI